MNTNVNESTMTEIVDGQLDAYNKGDYGLFISYYSSNILSYDLNSSQLIPNMCGECFFNHYRNKFLQNPNIHCSVIQRIAHENLVIDKEVISDYRNTQHQELVIYQVDDGLITKMWFSQELELEK